MVASVVRLLLFLGVLTAIICVSWNEPLRYRFISRAQIVEEENALRPPVAVKQEWRQFGTALDRAPYVRRPDGSIQYSKNYDRYRAGSATETTLRPNANQKGANVMRPGVNE